MATKKDLPMTVAVEGVEEIMSNLDTFHIIPDEWCRAPELTRVQKRGKGEPTPILYWPAMAMLSYIVRWYRTAKAKEGGTQRKFRGEKFELNYEVAARESGLTKNQAQAGIDHLHKHKIIVKVFDPKGHATPGGWVASVVTVEPNLDVLARITRGKPPRDEQAASAGVGGRGDAIRMAGGTDSNGTPLPFECSPYSKIVQDSQSSYSEEEGAPLGASGFASAQPFAPSYAPSASPTADSNSRSRTTTALRKAELPEGNDMSTESGGTNYMSSAACEAPHEQMGEGEDAPEDRRGRRLALFAGLTDKYPSLFADERFVEWWAGDHGFVQYREKYTTYRNKGTRVPEFDADQAYVALATLSEAQQRGFDPTDVIRQTIERNWVRIELPRGPSNRARTAKHLPPVPERYRVLADAVGDAGYWRLMEQRRARSKEWELIPDDWISAIVGWSASVGPDEKLYRVADDMDLWAAYCIAKERGERVPREDKQVLGWLEAEYGDQAHILFAGVVTKIGYKRWEEAVKDNDERLEAWCALTPEAIAAVLEKNAREDYPDVIEYIVLDLDEAAKYKASSLQNAAD